MICVVNANTNTCRFYHYEKNPSALKLIKEIKHLENKLPAREIISDRPGHFHTSGSAHGAFVPRSETKEIEYDNFSREIAQLLDDKRKKNGVEKFIIIAEPHMFGLLTLHLNKHVKDLIVNHIQKDLVHLSEQELLAFLKEHARFAD